MTAIARECKALNKAGQPCQAHALPGSEWCLHHDPARELQRRAARAKGGRARHGRKLGAVAPSQPVAVASIADIVTLLEAEINAVLTLDKSLNRARTIGYLAAVASKALEVSELETRLNELEGRYGEKHSRAA